MDLYYRRLPLSGVANVRDLGGYITLENYVTNYKKIVRCESSSELTEDDLFFLKEYGISMALDFRNDIECNKKPSKFINCEWVKYVHIPTFSANANEEINLKIDWGEKYIELLEDYKKWICMVMQYIAYNEGAILYSCTTGKDRTGVITALLLKLVDVSDCDIVADYSVSQIYLWDRYPIIFEDSYIDYNAPFFRTEPRYMKRVLNYIKEEYDSVKHYLYTCGVNKEEIIVIRNKLIH
ncbi:MAG: tyrosine-protein phosphatase [Lachnospiraceae bacterium]|nr:tyrosine-protein phosphatase [Lachnospiraceae bacterium]